MSISYKLRKYWNLLLRLPNRRGYGIHSPYAFGLVTGVVYERAPFYAYKQLQAARATATLREKDDRLMLRLANFQQPRRGVIVGRDTDVTRKYLEAGCHPCTWQTFASAEALRDVEEKPEVDMLVATGEDWEDAVREGMSRRSECALFVCHGIHRTTADTQAWKRLCRDERIRLSFDLYELGVLCFDPRFAKTSHTVFYT